MLLASLAVLAPVAIVAGTVTDSIGQEFQRACKIASTARIPEARNLCFPNHKRIVSILESRLQNGAAVDQHFIRDFHTVFEAYIGWPPAWVGISTILDPAREWTSPFCEHVLGDPMYNLGALIDTDANIPSATFSEGLPKLGPQGSGIHPLV